MQLLNKEQKALRLEWLKMLANWRYTGLTRRQRSEMVRKGSQFMTAEYEGVGAVIDFQNLNPVQDQDRAV